MALFSHFTSSLIKSMQLLNRTPYSFFPSISLAMFLNLLFLIKILFLGYSLHSILLCIVLYLCYFAFRSIVGWLDGHTHYKVFPPIYPAPTWHHTYFYRIIDYNSLFRTLHPHHYSYHQQFVLLNPFSFFTQSSSTPPLWRPPVCSLYLCVF